MMDVIRYSQTLKEKAEPHVMALVVRCESPTSAKPGNRGVVMPDGSITGWVGGGCAQPIVIEESRKALREGNPRLVRITPTAGTANVNGVVTYQMLCHSGGTLDIFIEPVLPMPQLIILGRSPVARTLARLAREVGYDVAVHAPRATQADFGEDVRFADSLDLQGTPRPQRSFVVVCTQGEEDEEGVAQALRLGAAYVGFVASPKKWATVTEVLKTQGLSDEQLQQVNVPAGEAISAVSNEEIAVSILARLVAVKNSPAYQNIPASGAANDATGESATASGNGEAEAGTGIDPICNMTVEIATARHVSEYQGQKVYFCCAGCKVKFEKDPAQYAGAGL